MPPAAIDHSVLEQLRVELEDEDGSAVADLVSTYLASIPELITEVTSALGAGDTAAAARAAHALLAPTVLMGAEGLATLLQRVQAGDPGLADAIGAEADRVVAELELFAV